MYNERFYNNKEYLPIITVTLNASLCINRTVAKRTQ